MLQFVIDQVLKMEPRIGRVISSLAMIIISLSRLYERHARARRPRKAFERLGICYYLYLVLHRLSAAIQHVYDRIPAFSCFSNKLDTLSSLQSI